MSLQSAFGRHVHYSRGVLRVCDDLYQFDSYTRVLVIAFGGHAHEMAALLAERLGTSASGIISAPKVEGQAQLPGFRYFHGGHPLPDAESVRAAEAILKSTSALNTNSLVLYLISAGSSFVEAPSDKEISLEDLRQAYSLLCDCAATPNEAQAVLKHLSAVKGGRMALAAAKPGVQQVSILFAEKAGDSPATIAGGPTMPDDSCVEDCYRIVSHYELVDQFPASVKELFVHQALEETPDKDHPAFHACRWWPIS